MQEGDALTALAAELAVAATNSSPRRRRRAAAAAEVASLKRQLATAADGSLARVRELEGDDGGDGAGRSSRRDGGESGELEIAMAEISPEEMEALRAFAGRRDANGRHGRRRRTRGSERARTTKRKRTGFAPEGSRAPVPEMASVMLADFEGEGSDAEGRHRRLCRALGALARDQEERESASRAACAAGDRVVPATSSTRTPGTFKKRTLNFSHGSLPRRRRRSRFVRTPRGGGAPCTWTSRSTSETRARATDAVADGSTPRVQAHPGAFKKRSLHFRAEGGQPLTRRHERGGGWRGGEQARGAACEEGPSGVLAIGVVCASQV